MAVKYHSYYHYCIAPCTWQIVINELFETIILNSNFQDNLFLRPGVFHNYLQSLRRDRPNATVEYFTLIYYR